MSRNYRVQDGTDTPGVISLIFGCLAVACLFMGFFTCGATYYAAVPFAVMGGLVGLFGRGNLRVAGLLLNSLALIPAIIVMVFVVGIIGAIGSSAVALKNDNPRENHATSKNDNPAVDAKSWVDEEIRRQRNDSTADYSVETKPSGELMIVQITFRNLPSSTDAASKIVRAEMEKAVAKDGSREILAMAFNEDGDALPSRYYGGALTYKPSDGKIVTMDQRRGVKIATRDEGAYFCKVTEEKTLEGITPSRSWLTCELVFTDSPSGEEFKNAALDEIKKLRHKQLDITVYAYVGNKSNPITWRQVKAANGEYMNMEYNWREEPAEIKRHSEASKKARETAKQFEAARQKQEQEDRAAVKLKIAKSLRTDSLRTEDQKESQRLEREYVNSLYEIIKKYPMTKAAKEAKELLDKIGK